MPGNLRSNKTKDEKYNGHKAVKLNGAYFQVVDDGGSPDEFLQTDDKCQAGVLEGDDGLGNQTGQHAPEGYGNQNVTGRLGVGHAGGVGGSGQIFADGLVSGAKNFTKIGRFEDNEGNHCRKKRVQWTPGDYRHYKIEPENDQQQRQVADEINIQGDRPVNPSIFGDAPQTDQGPQGYSSGQSKKAQLQGDPETAQQKGDVASHRIKRSYLPTMPGILKRFSIMLITLTTARPRIR